MPIFHMTNLPLHGNRISLFCLNGIRYPVLYPTRQYPPQRTTVQRVGKEVRQPWLESLKMLLSFLLCWNLINLRGTQLHIHWKSRKCIQWQPFFRENPNCSWNRLKNPNIPIILLDTSLGFESLFWNIFSTAIIYLLSRHVTRLDSSKFWANLTTG